MPSSSFITLDAFDSIHEANLVVAILAENGIDCVTENANLIAMDWFLTGAVGGIKIQVPADQVEQARLALELWRKSRAERIEAGKDSWIVFRCTNCKELVAIGGENAGRVENCPRCRRYVDVPAVSDPSLSEEVCQATVESAKSDVSPAGGRFLHSQWFLIIECLVVLCFAYFPYQYWAYSEWTRPDAGESATSVSFLSLPDNTNLIFQSMVVIACLFSTLVVHGTLRPFGITWEKAGRDTLLGLAAGIGLFLLERAITISTGVQISGVVHAESLSLGSERWLAIVVSGLIAVLLNSAAEELVMRGYLIVRIRQLTGSAILAVVVPAILFGGYHIYQGVYGAAMAAIIGLVLGYWFLRTGRLLGPVVAHSCINLAYMVCELVLMQPATP
jgi:membrane protease YdiL (CAAX protease family)